MVNFIKKSVPWEDRTPIYVYINNNVDMNGFLKSDSLPDDALKNENSKIKNIPGAKDGMYIHHSLSKENNSRVIELIKRLSINGRKKDKIEFYNIVKCDNCVAIAESVFMDIKNQNIKMTGQLYDWCRFLIFQSPDRGAVKIGIILSGALKAKKLKDDIKFLGRHEEFTFFSVLAILNMEENSDYELMKLGKQVHGWGRIHIVEHLARTKNPQIKYWMLTEGYKNSINYEYLAYISADTGELKDTLLQENVDEYILYAASDIIQALLKESIISGISIYNDAAESIELFIDHTRGKFKNRTFIKTYELIYNYITDEKKEWKSLEENGWTEEKRKNITEKIKIYS